MKKLTVLILSSVLSYGVLFAKDYNVDTAHSQVEFKIKHLSVSNVTGRFGDFNGSVGVTDGKLEKLSGEVVVDSVNTNNKERDSHIKDAEYFDVKKFPKATLELVSINGAEGLFNLTIKGTTKEVKLNVEIFGTSKNKAGKEVIGLNLSGSINRKDFGIAPSTPNVALGDNVNLSIDIEGIEK